jgi:hypothetical protein
MSHVIRCDVLQAEMDHRMEWLGETLEFMAERYPQLSGMQMAQLEMMGKQFLRPAIPHGSGKNAQTLERTAAAEEPDEVRRGSAVPAEAEAPGVAEVTAEAEEADAVEVADEAEEAAETAAEVTAEAEEAAGAAAAVTAEAEEAAEAAVPAAADADVLPAAAGIA